MTQTHYQAQKHTTHTFNFIHIKYLKIILIVMKATGTLAQMCWSKIRRTGNILSFSSSTSEL